MEKPAPGKNEVCVKIFATAVTASDCIIRGFNVPISFWLPMGLAVGFTKPRQPILGIVLAGEVESIGKDVKSFKRGD
jgi:alcohol dehydrogenase